MVFREFNMINASSAGEILRRCCGSDRWRENVLQRFPFSDQHKFIEAVTASWYQSCSESDWKAAFLHHPQIGDVNSLHEKYAVSKDIAEGEQAGMNNASREVLEDLVRANESYKEKFGFIFIVFASGRSAEEMLALLRKRLGNSVEDELKIAMGEQQKITMKRLRDQIEDLQLPASQITTHILDTTSGKPGHDVSIKFQHLTNGNAETIAQGITNSDGRIPNLLPPGRNLDAGEYRMRFETGEYFMKNNHQSFFPYAEITFIVNNSGHYHIPLLISPFGYTTYRGS